MKKRKKASSNRLMFFGTTSIFIILFFVAELFGFIFQVKNLNKEQQNITNEIKELKTEEDYLKNEIVKLKDPDYLARYARENYMYSKNGEYIIKVPETQIAEVNNTTDEQSKIWVISLSLLASIIFIFVLKKIF